MARRISVAATGEFGADVLNRLAAEHDVAQLLTRPDKPRGRGRKLAAPPAKEAAEALGIPVAQPAQLDALVELRRLCDRDPESVGSLLRGCRRQLAAAAARLVRSRQ